MGLDEKELDITYNLHSLDPYDNIDCIGFRREDVKEHYNNFIKKIKSSKNLTKEEVLDIFIFEFGDLRE